MALTSEQYNAYQDRQAAERKATGRPWSPMDGPRDRPPAQSKSRADGVRAYRDAYERTFGRKEREQWVPPPLPDGRCEYCARSPEQCGRECEAGCCCRWGAAGLVMRKGIELFEGGQPAGIPEMRGDAWRK